MNNIIPDNLIPSEPDIIELSLAIETRFVDLCDSYLRIRGMRLEIPKNLNRDFRRWREMLYRHRMRKDFRNTLSEKKSIRAIAEWTHKVNCEIRNQTFTPIHWKD